MSYAGRVQVINSVIGGLIGFWMQVFAFPKGFYGIDSLCKRFLWNGNGTGRKYMVAWSIVTLPYFEGGLGI